jgi:DNA transformation protein
MYLFLWEMIILTELSSLRNIGKEIERKLKSVSINSAEDLRKIGSKDAFFRLKIKYPEICLVHLYTLQGAIDNVDYNALSEETKKELKDFSDGLKR